MIFLSIAFGEKDETHIEKIISGHLDVELERKITSNTNHLPQAKEDLEYVF